MLRQHYIIAIGGSAGSLEALTVFFDHTIADHASYIIVRHLPGAYHTQLRTILKRHSQLHLVDVSGPTTLQKSTIYIAPTDKDLILKDSHLQLVEKDNTGPNFCVDRLFHSLSNQSIGRRIIAVVLSGSGSDGTKGIGFIKKVGGVVIAQDPLSCQFKYMPQNAIASGFVDYIAAPDKMPLIIQKHIHHLGE